MISFFLSVSLAIAGGPKAPRTPSNPYLKDVEFAMVLPDDCGPDTGCATVVNTGGTYLEISNDNVPGPTRVLDADGYTVGVYLDALPVFKGWSVDSTTGKTIPVVEGTFVSVMSPCLRSGFNTRTAVKVGAAKTFNVSATQIIFYAEDGADVVALDANTGAVIKFHPGWGERGGSGGVIRNVLHTSSGTSDIGWTARLGNGKCRDRS